MSSFLDILLLGKARGVLVLTIFGKIWQFREITCPRAIIEGGYLNAYVPDNGTFDFREHFWAIRL